MTGVRIIATTEQLLSLFDRITWSQGAANLLWRWECKETYAGSFPSSTALQGWLVNAVFQRPDRETGVLKLSDGWPVFVPVFEPETKVLKRLRGFCLHVLEHELDECFLYKGERIFDLHRAIAKKD